MASRPGVEARAAIRADIGDPEIVNLTKTYLSAPEYDVLAVLPSAEHFKTRWKTRLAHRRALTHRILSNDAAAGAQSALIRDGPRPAASILVTKAEASALVRPTCTTANFPVIGLIVKPVNLALVNLSILACAAVLAV